MRARAVQQRAEQIMLAMPDEFPPAYAHFQAEREEDIARLLAAHRPLGNPDAPGMKCVNLDCEGVTMHNMMDVYRHQASQVWKDGP